MSDKAVTDKTAKSTSKIHILHSPAKPLTAKRCILLPFAIFIAQWFFWSIWQNSVSPLLPVGVGMTLLESVVLKCLVWAIPFVLILCKLKGENTLSLREMFVSPFPWLACIVLLCMTTVFLYTVRIARGLVNTHAIFDPMFVVLSLSAGVFEELAFRGGMFNLHESAMGFWPAAIINGVMFTIYHYPELLYGRGFERLLSWRVLLIFVMGIVFCFMFRKWRNMALNMTVHTVWDILSFLFCIAG